MLFKLLNKSNRLKLPEARRPEEVGKTDNPNYCLYHRMLGHPTKSCYIFKDILQALIDAEVLKLRPEQKKVTANMTSDYSSICIFIITFPYLFLIKLCYLTSFLRSDVQTLIKRRKIRKEPNKPKKPNKFRDLRQSYLKIERKIQLNL